MIGDGLRRLLLLPVEFDDPIGADQWLLNAGIPVLNGSFIGAREHLKLQLTADGADLADPAVALLSSVVEAPAPT